MCFSAVIDDSGMEKWGLQKKMIEREITREEEKKLKETENVSEWMSDWMGEKEKQQWKH